MKYIKRFNENIFHSSGENNRIYSCLVELLDLGFNIEELSNKENKISIKLRKIEDRQRDKPLSDLCKEIGIYPGNIHKSVYMDKTIKTKPANRANSPSSWDLVIEDGVKFTEQEQELIELVEDVTNKILHTFNYQFGDFSINPYFSRTSTNISILINIIN